MWMLTEAYPADFSGFVQGAGLFIWKETALQGSESTEVRHASAYTHPFTSQRGTRLTPSKLWLHCLAELTLQSALSNLEGLRCFLPSDLGSVLHRGIVWPVWTDHRLSRCRTDSYDHPANLQLCLPSLCASYASRSSTRFPGITHRVGSLRGAH